MPKFRLSKSAPSVMYSTLQTFMKIKINQFISVDITCMKLTISYTGLDDESMGNHVVKIMSWFITMRTVHWIMWYANPKSNVYLETFWMIGIYPAYVIYPLSWSLFGSSSHVKEFVRLRRCWMSR